MSIIQDSVEEGGEGERERKEEKKEKR